MSRTVWYIVADLKNPVSEPFIVIRVNTSIRSGTGVEGEVVSLHWNRTVAKIIANRLNDQEQRACALTGT